MVGEAILALSDKIMRNEIGYEMKQKQFWNKLA